MRPSHAPHARRPLRLLAFGGATLVDAGGSVVAEQRRRIALLSLIAAGRGQGVSRDKLVAYLSPESPAESARHALQQLVYYVRQQAGDDVFIGVDPLRLNPEIVTSDVLDFEEATERGRTADAVALYRGPFLDGFHLADSMEFDEWEAGERVRLARLCTEGVLALATAAERDGDPIAAAHWWGRLAVVDPESQLAAIGLTRALRSAGDAAESLGHAPAYAADVRRRLDIVHCLAADLRAERRLALAAGDTAAAVAAWQRYLALPTNPERQR